MGNKIVLSLEEKISIQDYFYSLANFYIVDNNITNESNKQLILKTAETMAEQTIKKKELERFNEQ